MTSNSAVARRAARAKLRSATAARRPDQSRERVPSKRGPAAESAGQELRVSRAVTVFRSVVTARIA